MAGLRAYRLVQELQERGHDVLLTGGLAIEAWSERDFKTGDWDLVGGANVNFDEVHRTLRELGYEKRGNTWYLTTGDLPPRNGGEFIVSQYLWGKTYTVEFRDRDLEIETVAPEWLYVNRCKKAWQGRPSYAEQALFLLEKFGRSDAYDWNKKLIEGVADRLDVPEKTLKEDWLKARVLEDSS